MYNFDDLPNYYHVETDADVENYGDYLFIIHKIKDIGLVFIDVTVNGWSRKW